MDGERTKESGRKATTGRVSVIEAALRRLERKRPAAPGVGTVSASASGTWRAVPATNRVRSGDPGSTPVASASGPLPRPPALDAQSAPPPETAKAAPKASRATEARDPAARSLTEVSALRAPPAPAPEKPVLTLEPPRPKPDACALAGLLADDAAAKLDQLCYIWNVVQELEPFGRAGEASLRRRAAELFLVAGGGAVEIPLEGPLRAVRTFLGSHGMSEAYCETLAAWYLDRKR